MLGNRIFLPNSVHSVHWARHNFDTKPEEIEADIDKFVVLVGDVHRDSLAFQFLLS